MSIWKYSDPDQKVAVRELDGGAVEFCLASALDLADGEVIDPYVAPPPVVPTVVSMRQARLALLSAGKLDAVAIAIAAMPSPAKEAAQIEWEFAAEVRRDNPLMAALAGALGLDTLALDQLFTHAGAL